MKKVGYVLTEKTVTKELCAQAIIEASRGKRKHGTVRYALQNIDKAANNLRNMILNGTYTPHQYKPCIIIDKPSGKRRVLHKPLFYPDQCVHHICIMLSSSVLLKKMDPYCIGSVPGKGQIYGHRAIRRWIKNDKKGTKYCAKCDIKKCYESITPSIIIEAFKKIFKDNKYLELISVIANGHETLPLGNYTSSWFMNVVLSVIDKTARADPSTKHYLRYIDDFIIFGSNKRKLHKTIKSIMDAIKPLHLEVKANWQVFPTATRGVDILGYRYFSGYTLLRRRNALSARRQAAKIMRKQKFGEKTSFTQAAGFLSRIGQLKHCNGYNFKKKYLSEIKISKLKDVIRNENRNNNDATAWSSNKFNIRIKRKMPC